MNRNDKNPHMCEEARLQEAIAVLELGSVARGMEVADAILWEADIDLLVATHVQPGKYVLLFSGTVQDLTSALARGAELADCELVDQLLIPQVHPRALDALRREDTSINGNLDAVGVVETRMKLPWLTRRGTSATSLTRTPARLPVAAPAAV